MIRVVRREVVLGKEKGEKHIELVSSAPPGRPDVRMAVGDSTLSFTVDEARELAQYLEDAAQDAQDLYDANWSPVAPIREIDP